MTGSPILGKEARIASRSMSSGSVSASARSIGPIAAEILISPSSLTAWTGAQPSSTSSSRTRSNAGTA
jgi:hypothetical protein